MSWIYNDDLRSNKDKVRFLVGDVNSSDQLMTDEAIAVLLTDNGDNVYFAAADVAGAISLKLSKASSIQIDGFRVDYSERVRSYRDLALTLRQRGNSGGTIGAPSVSGISISEMDSVDSDEDRVPLKAAQVDDE